MTLERPTATPLRVVRSITAERLASLTATLSTWSGLSTMQALQLWRRVFREPTHSNKIFHSLLLMKIHGEQRTTDFLQRLYVATRLQLPLNPFEFEHPAGGEGHTVGTGEGEDVDDESVFSTLDYYEGSEIMGILALVRYTADFFEVGGLNVTERSYTNTAEGFCALERDVPEALSIGVDVAILTHVDSEDLPEINQFLTDSPTEV